MMKTIDCLLALALVGIAVQAHAADDEKAVLADLQQRYPGTHFSRVSTTPVAGLYEVVMGNSVVYVGRDTRYFLFGRLVDVQTMQDLTAPKLNGLQQDGSGDAHIAFSDLPLHDAIKTVRGNGTRVLAVFSDPLCPHCKALEHELAKLDDITIYTFLVPFLGTEKPLAIWCARDAATVWPAYMLRGDESQLATSPACDNPLQRNRALAEKLRLHGTPALIADDGRVRMGAADAGVLKAWMVVDDPRAGSKKTQALTSTRSPE